MKKLIALQVTLLSLPLFAQTFDLELQREAAIEIFEAAQIGPSRLVQEKAFAFYENCERMPAKIETTDPVTGHPRQMAVEIYRTRPKPKRGVLILPPTGGKNRLDELYAEQLCEKGIEAWILTHWDKNQKDYSLEEDILSHDMTGVRGVVGVRQIISHMPTEKVGVLGTSAGGILASVVLALEPRASVGVFIASGANMPEILFKSDLPSLRKLRRQRMEVNGWTEEEYRQQLHQSVVLDAKLFQEELSYKTVGTVIALRDRTVPVATQYLLEELSGAQRIATFDDDHFNTIVQTGLLIYFKVIDFFRANL